MQSSASTDYIYTSRYESYIKGIPSSFSAIIASAPARNGMADGAT